MYSDGLVEKCEIHDVYVMLKFEENVFSFLKVCEEFNLL